MTTITALPPAPSRADPSTFSDKADAFVAALPTFRTQANALASEVNAWSSSASNSAAIAIASANFKGAWSSLTGALNIPASVLHSSQLWLLVADVADVTAHTPGVSASWVDLETIQADGLGYNQTWQDVTASRAKGTNYTSPADKPIQVSVQFTTTSATSSNAGIYINSVEVSFFNRPSGSSANGILTLSAVVPPNTTYSVYTTNGVINKWTELR